MFFRRTNLIALLGRWLVVVAVLWGNSEMARAGAEQPADDETITNLAQIPGIVSSNAPARRLVRVDLTGTVFHGGEAQGVVALDGSPTFYHVSAQLAGRLRRGQRVEIQGHCLVDGTNLLLEPRPLIENDGLHSMFEQAAGVWLHKGWVPIRVRYFNRTGDRGLELWLKGPSLARQKIPDGWLFHAVTNSADGTLIWQPGLQFKCFEGSWSALPDFSGLPAVAVGIASNFDITVAGRQDDFGLDFDGALAVPRAGFYTLACASDDGSLVDLGPAGLAVRTLGEVTLPPMPRLAAGQLVDGRQETFCAALEGTVTFATRVEGRLRLELSNGRGKADVRVASDLGMDPQWLVGARVLATGLGRRVFAAEGYEVAGQLTVYSDDDLQVLDLPKGLWNMRAKTTAAEITANLKTNQQARLVRLQGVLEPAGAGWTVEDRSGRIALVGADALRLGRGAAVEVAGVAVWADGKAVVRCHALREITPARGGDQGLPLLTTVAEVKQMSREEAKRGYPVNVRGVITFVWPNAGFFLQDGTRSIDVRLATNDLGVTPQIGDYWQVEGRTFAEFAPDILATRASRLGAGSLPDPEHPNWTQLVDGSMDTQYIEVQGVALSAEGTALNLLTRGGRIKVQLPEAAPEVLAGFCGALVRVRGCVIPGRDVNTQQVKLGEFVLRNTLVAVEEPAPADPFALPLEHATDLLLFDSHVSPVERARIGGIVLLQRGDVIFLMDRSNGVRVISEAPVTLHPGDQIEAVGFPDLTGPSPVFNSAVVRYLGHEALPAALPLPADHLLSGQFDSIRVTVEGTLVGQRNSGADQILEMRSGARPWLARLPLRAAPLPGMSLGSVLKLTGVYAGLGGDRLRGREIDSFELLLSSAPDVAVLNTPSWWTARRALAVACGLLAVLLLAAIWIWALHRQVEERTRALKSEIDDHKRTEVELEKKTELLTREIEERCRIEAEVERGHKQLLVTSRLAGMAEVATSVLHNVGNVMTSINVLSASIVDLVRNSKVASVVRLGELLRRQRHELDHFVTQDERGRKMPDYVGQLGAHLAEEQSRLLQKVQVLNENIQHINEIVGMQQDFAKVSGVLETLPPNEVVEDALRMHGESLKRHDIKLIRDFEPIPAVTMDRHKVLQILFNLLENAKYACLQGHAADKTIVVRLQRAGAHLVRLTVADNGMGIPPENLTRIFGQGFSTRKDGHGFGLHSSVLAAQDMGGSLTARSEGLGKGATFVLEIPQWPPGAALAKN